MKKNILLIFPLLMIVPCIYGESLKDIYMEQLFGDLSQSIDIYSRDYSLISGFYTANGVLKGSATIGNFPSFRIGATVGVILFTNPIRFLKNISYSNKNWEDVRHYSKFKKFGKYLDWFDNNCLPVPMTNYFFEIGIKKGLSVGGSFHVVPAGDFVNGVSNETDSYLKYLFLWGLGININYTILKEYKYFPSISVGTGVNYSDSSFTIDNIPVSPVFFDPINDSVPTYMGFSTHNYTTSFSFDFTISKLIYFFQPFLSCKFIQTINYNVTTINVEMDLSDATGSAKDIYKNGKYEITNYNIKSGETIPRGDVIPVGDFVLSAGFEFAITFFRLGFQASFSCVSQKSMLLVDMRFHLEDWNFKKKNKDDEKY